MTGILTSLFVMFIAAKIAGEAAERLRMPAVIGELLAGVIIGPHALGLIGAPGADLISLFHGDEAAAKEASALIFHTIAELGVTLLMFFVGLETRASEMTQVGGRAAAVAVAGVALPLGLGWGLMGPGLGYAFGSSLFVSVALVATSVGSTARTLRDLGALSTRESRIILGAAVIDDILGLLALGAASGATSSSGASPAQLALVAAEVPVVIVVFQVLLVVNQIQMALDIKVAAPAENTVAVAAEIGMVMLALTV